MTVRAGGCLCGEVRYEAEGEPLWAAHCHCASCRRATGAPMATWAGFRRGDVRWTAAKPESYRSSPGAERCFCASCGTPLSYESARWADETHILAATLDDPEAVTPERHVYWAEHLSWMESAGTLPKSAGTDGGS